MQHLEQVVEESDGGIVGGLIDGLRLTIDISGLHHFQIPARELVPKEFVDGHQRFRNAILLELCLQLGMTLLELCSKPYHRLLVGFGLFHGCRLPALHQAESIPYLVVEIASLLTQRFVKENVVACGRAEHHAHAHTISAILFNQGYGIGRITKTLAHLATQFVAHNAREINVFERIGLAIFIAGHDHACHPEEDDVGTGYEVGRRIVIAHFFVVGMVDAIEHRDGPQPRREPCV